MEINKSVNELCEEHHIDYLEAQLHAIKEIGLPNYLAQQLIAGGGNKEGS